jgi:2-alkyl-3-oxoalkanoate reductase
LAEQIVLFAQRIDAVALRPHLVWGPGDQQLIARIVQRARSGRLTFVGSGAALVDTTYVTNAADAIVAGLDRCDQLHGQALTVTNGEPRPIAQIVAQVCRAAGVRAPSAHVPRPVAWVAGAAVEGVWAALGRAGRPLGDPPMTRFLAEQLSTAHWFDQRATRTALQWTPAVSLDDGFARLADWYAGRPAE